MSGGDLDKLFDESAEIQSAGQPPEGLAADESAAMELTPQWVEAGVEGGEVPSAEEEVTSGPAPAEEAAEEEKPRRPGIFARLTQTSPYVVMLLLSLVALIVGTVMLGVELWRYQFEIKPPG